jgi:hypothetical protein
MPQAWRGRSHQNKSSGGWFLMYQCYNPRCPE